MKNCVVESEKKWGRECGVGCQDWPARMTLASSMKEWLPPVPGLVALPGLLAVPLAGRYARAARCV